MKCEAFVNVKIIDIDYDKVLKIGKRMSKTRKWPYLRQMVENEKIKALSLLEGVKFKEAKCL